MKLRNHIVIRLLILFLGLAACIIISVYLVFQSAQNAFNEAKTSLINNSIKTGIERNGRLNELITVLYEQVSMDISTINNETVNYLSQSRPVQKFYTTYYGNPSIDNRYVVKPPVDYYGNDLFSTTYQHGIQNLAQLMQVPYINETSLQDNIFFSAFAANSGFYIHVLAATQSTGLLRMYPFSNLASLDNLQYICANGSNVNMLFYDPRCRVWYTQAAFQFSNQTFFTSPYVDATLQTSLMSASQAVYFPDGVFWGVVGIDFNMQLLDNFVNTIQVSTNGYLVLIDSKGNVISSKKWNRLTNPINPTIFQLESEIDSSYWFTILSSYNDANNALYLVVGNQYYVFYSYIPISQQYILMIIPQDDVHAQANAFDSDIQPSIQNGAIAISIVVVFIVGCVVFYGLYEANQATLPLQEMSSVLDQMRKNNLDIQLGNRASPAAEIAAVRNNMTSLLVAIKFGNKEYAEGNDAKALQFYEQAEEVMRLGDKKHALGICYNNKAGVYRRMKCWNQSIDLYNQSIEMARQLAEECQQKIADCKTSEEQKPLMAEKQGHQIARGNRLMNLAVVYRDQNYLTQAMHHFKMSLDLHRSCDNSAGIAKVLCNMALVNIDRKEYETAQSDLNEAQGILESKQMARDKDVWLAAVFMHKGILYEAWNSKYLNEAIDSYKTALIKSAYIDITVQNMCADALLRLLLQRGTSQDTELYNNIKNTLQGQQFFIHKAEKHVCFVQDVSESMQGHPLRACINSIQKIIQQHINDNDHIRILTFGDTVREMFPLNKQRDTKKTELKQIDRVLNSITADGRTAFYDALYKAVDEQSEFGWIVALTDGADNESASNRDAQIRMLLGSKKVNLIIITVGTLDNLKIIQTFCQFRQRPQEKTVGVHISCENGGEEINKAFEKAAHVMMSGQINMETL